MSKGAAMCKHTPQAIKLISRSLANAVKDGTDISAKDEGIASLG
jgi:alcohol dehydrogenase class IV